MKKVDVPSYGALTLQLEINELEEDLFKFVLWVFKEVYKKPFKINWHHKMLCKILMDIHSGKLLHTIINMPPRYSKTEIVVKIFVAWCYAKNQSCEFLHLAYSDDLALSNSSAVKAIIESVEFQQRWKLNFRKDTTAKKKWKTELDGEFSAVASGGSVTGFGAGKIGATEFAGAIIIDDPLKPDDAKSDAIRNSVNERFPETIISRLNDRKTPMIIIMQRLHEDDPVGFLLGGGTELEFTHIKLPAINEDGPSEYDQRESGEALWDFKHTAEELEQMRIKSAMNYAGQYQQRPAPKEGNIFKIFKYYKTVPDDLFHRVHSWDMSFKAKSKNKKGKISFVVGTEWAKRRSNGDIFLLPDIVRKKMGYDETEKAFTGFIEKHPNHKAILVEDKANGIIIIQRLQKKFKRILPIEPNGDKEERAEATAPLWNAGSVWLPHPSICPWIEDFVNEHKVFPNGKYDDQVDSGTQAVGYLDTIGNSPSMGQANKKKFSPFSKKFNNAPPNRRKEDSKSRLKIKAD